MKLTVLFFAATAVIAPMSFATTATILADADTTIHENFPANNFGARTTLQAGATTVRELIDHAHRRQIKVLLASGSSARTRALVSFSVGAAVPPGATILSARLKLTATDAPPIPRTTQAFEIRRIQRAWSEGTQSTASGGPAAVNDATWSHRLYPNVAWAAAGTDLAASASAEIAVGDAASYSFESTGSLVANVQAWLDRPEENYGWALLGKNESVAQSARTFASREDTARAPSLEIEFSTDTPGFRVSDIVRSGGQLTLNWTGGRAPFQIYTRPELGSGTWSPVGVPIAGNGASINVASPRAFFQVTSEPTAEYDVVFNATWSPATHPTDFPGGAHWSGLVGGLHDNRVEFWRPGAPSSVGIQRVAELGSKTSLLGEVNAAIAAGSANRTLSGGDISGGAGTVTLRFQIDRTHPLVTLVTMVAPSPDWFAGVRGLPLVENGQWVQSKTVALFPWDTGTDSGATFTSPDFVTTPRGVLTRIVTPPLGANGVTPPMGTFTFTLVRIVPAP